MRHLFPNSFFLLAGLAIASPARGAVEFNRDIRPILSENCFACHGPDEAKRMTALRLDTEEGANVSLAGDKRAIVPGEPESSELYLRISAVDEGHRMPPAAFGHDRLSDRQIGLLREWIQEGALWQGHWSFLKPDRPAIPPNRHSGWPVNPVDSFILRRLQAEGMEPSPPASKETLVRRLALDITGLPPDLADVDAFLADSSPDAYETLVDRLLASSSYGERMAVRWLDAARYADTNGYQTDAERYMWRWRDWVIDAFSANKPFDEFTVEQIAGDMLPGADLQQVIATGFNRNHRGNGEGGIVDAEYAVEYVVDRVDTTSTVWLGLTLGCARCHDHKYDPFTQKEYYELFAYFNNVPEKGKAFKYGNSPPFVKAPTQEQSESLAEMDSELRQLRAQRNELEKGLAAARQAWETATSQGREALDWADGRDLVMAFPKPDENWKDEPRRFDGGDFEELGDAANFGFYDRFSVAAWIRADSADGAIISKTRNVPGEEDTQGNPGWGFYIKDGRLQVNMINRWLDDCLRLESQEEISLGEWYHVAFTYDGTRLASGLRIYLDGKPVPLKIIRDEMNQEFRSKEPLRIGRGLGLDYRGELRRLLVYGRALTEDEVAVLAVRGSLPELASVASRERSGPEALKLSLAFRDSFGPTELTALTARIRDLERRRQEAHDAVPTVMVMAEMTPRKKTYRLDRGAYDAPAEEVLPGLPAALSQADPADRLGFARWLVSQENPLTARVTVNRIWQMLWGRGIVRTVEDFGSQGEWPTHPDLLDWLAVDFMESGWDVKDLVKTIVMSGAYRQSSRFAGESTAPDPGNALYSRGPRLRLPAESVRDLSLAISGLLVDRVGGPSVRPYQPPGLWTELAGGQDYEVGPGAELYRRSLYTFWKRAVPPPSLMIFDSAGREVCTVTSVRTNTPLQALNRMNDAAYLETSRALVQRVMREVGPGHDQRLARLFRLATSRHPKPEEAQVLASGFHYHLDRYRTDTNAAVELLGAEDADLLDASRRPELAAYTMMASLVLNLDEAITRE